MTLRDHSKLALLCTVAAVTSGTAVTLLSATPQTVTIGVPSQTIIRTIPVQTSSLPEPKLKPGFSSITETEPSARFRFVSLNASDELFTALAEDEVAAEDPAAWVSETTVTLAPTSIVRLPDGQQGKLPWQASPVPGFGTSASLSDKLRQIGPSAHERLQAKFVEAKAPWQPAELALVALKDEKILELFAKPSGGSWTFIHRYPVLAASGASGPKLRRGDKQVPEGVYRITFLNPNSRYHVALRVGYPNAFDRRMGAQDGRKDLGGDIMIHGKAASVGCLAIGDEAAEELFVLAAETGLQNIKLIIAPNDLRKSGLPTPQDGQPQWLPQLYAELAAALEPFKSPPQSNGLLSLFSN
jgi:hypothetical protein